MNLVNLNVRQMWTWSYDGSSLELLTNYEVRWVSIVLNLFLIYNPKHCYASLFNKLYEVLVCAGTAWSCSCTWISVKQNALCWLWGACCCFVHYFS